MTQLEHKSSKISIFITLAPGVGKSSRVLLAQYSYAIWFSRQYEIIDYKAINLITEIKEP